MGMVAKTFKKCWQWTWVVTLPVTVLFLVWLSNTTGAYKSFRLKYKATMPISLHGLGSMHLGLLTANIKGAALSVVSDARGLDAVHLYVQESELKKLSSDLPYSGRKYVKASLLYPDGKVYEVKMKYRGDFSYHWSDRKKSIRVKTKKDGLYNGVREFNLIIPKTKQIINDHVSFLLAKRMGLMAPESKPVEVYINGRYIGVQIFTEQIGEQFLRRNSRVPGDVYVGELVGDDVFPLVGTEVFLNPAFWKKAAVNNHNPPEWMEAMEELSRAVYADDIERLRDLLDMDSWAAFAAFITITRNAHFDTSHNWRLFFDPVTGKFAPIVWDPLSWNYKDFVPLVDRQKNPMDIITNIVFERLHRDHAFLKAKHEAIEEFFGTLGDEFILKAAGDTVRIEASLRRDRNLHFESSYVLGASEVIDAVRNFRGQLDSTLKEVRKAYIEDIGAASYSVDEKTGKIQVNIEGFAPIKSLEVKYSGPASGAVGASVSYLKDGRRETKDVSHSIRKEGDTLRIEASLFAGRTMTLPEGNVSIIIRDAKVRPASYIIAFKGASGKVPHGKVAEVRALYAGGKSVELKKAEVLEMHALDGNTGIVPVREPLKEDVWGKDVVLSGVTEVKNNLTIMPGVTVRLNPGASLVVRGRFNVKGKKGRPVVFEPAGVSQKPWGAVVIAGSGADGSTLSNCVLRGGSGLKHALVEYSGMLSIHNVKAVTIDACSFSENKEVDDMVRAAYSEVYLRNSTFTGARADAMDFDYVSGRVEGSLFTGSGNDGLDLMSSQVAVINSEMRGSGDKGISVGEGTEVFVWNTILTGNTIGIQAKDGSRAVVYNADIIGNKKAIDVYKKNWQYGEGGHAFVYKSRIEGDGEAITADKSSGVKVYDSYLAGKTGGKQKRIHIDETVDSDAAFVNKARSADSLIDASGLPAPLRPYIGLIKPLVRGVAKDAA